MSAKNVSQEYKVAMTPTDKPVAVTPRTLPRSMSLDAYRGFIMLAMASSAFSLPTVAKNFPDDPTWQELGYQFDHVSWIGCAFWDLIQPAFMFMVGVAMAYSYSGRQAKGQSYGRMLGHACVRAFVLAWLGVFLRSVGQARTEFTFVDVVSQIGLGYVFLFLLWNRHVAWQLLAAAVVLGGYWAAFYFYPLPAEGFDYASVGLDENWVPLEGMSAHWEKNVNLAADFDRWFLNLFPREEEYVFNSGGYQTLNFVPSLGTMIFGLMAGQWMRTIHGSFVKLLGLLLGGAALAAGGYALHHFGLCPLVKRIWTPSWAVFSAGCATIMLAVFYGLVDVLWLRKPAWPLVVVGMNSITIYCMSKLMGGWILANLSTHFGPELFTFYGRLDEMYASIATTSLTLFVMWAICAWLWMQRVFIRI